MKSVTQWAKAVALLPGLLLAAPAYAAPINWTLSPDAYFADVTTFPEFGLYFGSASGTFTTDSVTGGLLSWDITTVAGTGSVGGFHYDGTTSYLYANELYGEFGFLILANDFHRYLNLSFENALTAPGVNPLIPYTDPLDGSWECLNCFPLRGIISGSAVGTLTTLHDEGFGVPEPATSALILAGLGLMGFASRRRKPVIAA